MHGIEDFFWKKNSTRAEGVTLPHLLTCGLDGVTLTQFLSCGLDGVSLTQFLSCGLYEVTLTPAFRLGIGYRYSERGFSPCAVNTSKLMYSH